MKGNSERDIPKHSLNQRQALQPPHTPLELIKFFREELLIFQEAGPVGFEPTTAGLGGSPKPLRGGLSGALSILGYGPLWLFSEILYKLNSVALRPPTNSISEQLIFSNFNPPY